MSGKLHDEYLDEIKESNPKEYEHEIDKLNARMRRMRVVDQIEKFRYLSDFFRYAYHTFQVIIVVGATLVPFLLNIPELSKVVPTILSAVVAISVALINFYQFPERSKRYFFVADKLQRELDWYKSSTGHYENLSYPIEAFEIFEEKVKAILREQLFFSFSVGKPKEGETVVPEKF